MTSVTAQIVSFHNDILYIQVQTSKFIGMIVCVRACGRAGVRAGVRACDNILNEEDMTYAWHTTEEYVHVSVEIMFLFFISYISLSTSPPLHTPRPSPFFIIHR
jgi:hypothetical protein